MGAYSTDDLVPPLLEKTILEVIAKPTIRALAAEGRPYKGFLYFGLMLTRDGPKVLEFNCRMGDPEAQPIVVRMGFDLVEAFEGVCGGNLDKVKASWKGGASVCVVMASGGYPGRFETGKRIEGVESVSGLADVVVFHAGSRLDGAIYYTSGGRVLGVTAAGLALEAAIHSCYEAVSKIRFEGAHYRKDIGAQWLSRTRAAGD